VSPRVSEADAQELADCFRLLSGPLLGYAMVLTRRRRPLAEDIVQEAFCAAGRRWVKIRDFSDEQRLFWLKGVARKKAIDVFRRETIARGKQMEIASAGDASTHSAVMLKLADVEMWAALRKLPSRQHLVACMRFKSEMPIAAIADELGVSVGTVSNDLKRVRRVMQKVVDDFIDLGGQG